MVFTPAGDDYRPGRRGYRAVGQGATRWHQACYDERERYEAASRLWYAWEQYDEYVEDFGPSAERFRPAGERPTAPPVIAYPEP